jgi:hypothetical protein
MSRPPVPFHRLDHGRRARVGGEVADRDVGLAAGLADRPRHGLGTLAVAPMDDHHGALARQDLGDARADPRAAARHQGPLAGQLQVHAVLLRS